MAKMRAFQLAQELEMDSKEFMETMSAIGVSLKSHMSAIPEEEIEGIKKKIEEYKRVRTEDRRVGSTIIRRRAAKAPPPPPAAEVAPEPQL
ncbi:MAG: translation initiation factor IF-2 N-terminal domain-containing protein, partial [Myxococcota bacterium]